MSRESNIQNTLRSKLILSESQIIILASILNRAGNDDTDIENIISIIEEVKESSFIGGQESTIL